ncbi:preprotein translocase subunit SecB [Constrictibacter sp. MBR-5]|jgi:preprotein translocase subunit SecB|uniref:protein-export chaperone SecB n=1 Tax=Constrictibacter sp. MBR-5 TaxID=3156467 RepID=UPI00339280FB
MADTGDTNQGTQPQAGQAPDLPPLSINVQYVKDLSFENPRAPQSFGELGTPPEINVDINVEVQPLQQRVVEVVLNIRVRAAREEAVFFMVELSYAGICVVGNVPDQHVQPLVTIEGPRLLFPFARQIIADSVRNGGFPPLLINPIDFGRLYQQNAAQQQATAPAAPTVN